jgi:hypothetical protein
MANKFPKWFFNDASAILGTLAIVIALIIALGDAKLALFLDIPGAAFVILVVSGFMIFGQGVSRSVRAIADAIGGSVASEEEGSSSLDALTLGIQASVIAGVMSTAAGLILMLARLDDPEVIGPCVAMALCSIFYGSLAAGLFAAGRVRVSHAIARLRASEKAGEPPAGTLSGRNALGVLVLAPIAVSLIAAFFVYLAGNWNKERPYIVELHDQTGVNWIVSGKIGFSGQEAQLLDRMLYTYGKLHIPCRDSKSKGEPRWVRLVLLQEDGLNKIVIQRDWPAETKTLTIEVTPSMISKEPGTPESKPDEKIAK